MIYRKLTYKEKNRIRSMNKHILAILEQYRKLRHELYFIDEGNNVFQQIVEFDSDFIDIHNRLIQMELDIAKLGGWDLFVELIPF